MASQLPHVSETASNPVTGVDQTLLIADNLRLKESCDIMTGECRDLRNELEEARIARTQLQAGYDRLAALHLAQDQTNARLSTQIFKLETEAVHHEKTSSALDLELVALKTQRDRSLTRMTMAIRELASNKALTARKDRALTELDRDLVAIRMQALSVRDALQNLLANIGLAVAEDEDDEEDDVASSDPMEH
ncbi:hypothetical protein MIND_01190200 [Mycena indigotica]|uniref:Uncharacterized protein n=1 Tax=Mycena indigotica TaxID=2126181 RepID=A0A8H6S4Y9_9AGAR|nr:uncharacterized protein MIND_01190200 [Mycena indigotica]KAF7292911.1 hypothetical protein MIND_01190200 [Mycena indigotica]